MLIGSLRGQWEGQGELLKRSKQATKSGQTIDRSKGELKTAMRERVKQNIDKGWTTDGADVKGSPGRANEGTKGREECGRGSVRVGADSLTMQCGTVCTLCISALIQLSLIDINLRVAKQRNVGRAGRGVRGAWLHWNMRNTISGETPTRRAAQVQLTLFVIWSRTFQITKCTTTLIAPPPSPSSSLPLSSLLPLPGKWQLLMQTKQKTTATTAGANNTAWVRTYTPLLPSCLASHL